MENFPIWLREHFWSWQMLSGQDSFTPASNERASLEFFDFWVQASCLHLEIKKHDRKEVESLAAKSFLKDVFIDTL